MRLIGLGSSGIGTRDVVRDVNVMQKKRVLKDTVKNQYDLQNHKFLRFHERQNVIR